MLITNGTCSDCGNLKIYCRCFNPSKWTGPHVEIPRYDPIKIYETTKKSRWCVCPKCDATNIDCLVCEGTGLISELTGNPPKREKNAEK